MQLVDMQKLSLRNGSYFFNKDTMAVWGTDYVSASNKWGLFITRDDDYTHTQKFYSVRHFNETTGDISEIVFQLFSTKEAAMAWRKYASGVFKSLGVIGLEVRDIFDTLVLNGAIQIPDTVITDFDVWFKSLRR